MGRRGPKPAKGHVVELMSHDSAPKCPKFLKKDGRAKWREITTALANMGRLMEADSILITMVCVSWEKYIDAITNGKNRDDQDVMGLTSQIRLQLNALGLTPASRENFRPITPAKPKRPEDPIRRILDRKRRNP